MVMFFHINQTRAFPSSLSILFTLTLIHFVSKVVLSINAPKKLNKRQIKMMKWWPT